MRPSSINVLTLLAFGYSAAQTPSDEITLSPEERQMLRQMPVSSLRLLPVRLISALLEDNGTPVGNIPGAAIGPAVLNPTTMAASGTVNGIVLPELRISVNAVPGDFDSPSSPFKPNFVKGLGVQFSDVINFPSIAPSPFDKETLTKAFSISVNDESVFFPGGNNFVPEENLRRVDLMPAERLIVGNSSTSGVRAVHLSLMPDAERPLNYTHQYTLFQLETALFDANQVELVTGGRFGRNYTVLGRSGGGVEGAVLWSAPVVDREWLNLGVLMDFDRNTVQLFSSTGGGSLNQQTQPVPNNLAGNGEYHFGVIKGNLNNAPHPSISQPEGFVFGGIFFEPGVMRLSPNGTNA